MSEPVGIIYPPPELRGIVDSTAKYVAKNGGAFEERIKREHRDKPKFSFLLPDDPFNAYYQFKVKEIRGSLLSDIESKIEPVKKQDEIKDDHRQQGARQDAVRGESNDNPDEPPRSPHSQISGQQDDPKQTDHEGEAPRVRLKLNEYIQEMTMKLEKPPTLNYIATPAPHLDHKDSDTIKLTSQFIATYGRTFLLELVSREQSNIDFDFVKPQHGQYSYMSNLIMQYALIQNQPLDIVEQLNKDATSQKHVLEKIKMRAEWNKMLELEQKKRQEAEEREKILYDEIDWHDFVIVETIDYTPDERGEYPPTTADQVGTRLLIQQRFEEQHVPEEMEIDMDVESDQESDSADDKSNEQDFALPQPPKPDKVIIKKDYDPKNAIKGASQGENYFVSPITNERISVDKIHEHVRYNLADSKHLEKKDKKLQERMSEETVFASGSQIQNNLKSLAERRTDIFGFNEKEAAIGRRIGEEEQVQAKDDRLIWDGHKSSLKKKKLG